jgi:hypothetical protein
MYTVYSICETDKYGIKRWYHKDKLHRNGDLPAIEFTNGTKHWYQNGELHREGDRPAIEGEDGDKYWYWCGKRHRGGDRPAAEYDDGDKHWYQNGKLHRNGDRPAIEYADGSKEWYKYNIHYTRELLITYYLLLARFGRYCLKKIRVSKLKQLRWIHGELLCKPPRGNFPGGKDYHKMVDYFNRI